MNYRYQNQSKTNLKPIEKQLKNNSKMGYKIYSYETNRIYLLFNHLLFTIYSAYVCSLTSFIPWTE